VRKEAHREKKEAHDSCEQRHMRTEKSCTREPAYMQSRKEIRYMRECMNRTQETVHAGADEDMREREE
jgi:hypothetical protein